MFTNCLFLSLCLSGLLPSAIHPCELGVADPAQPEVESVVPFVEDALTEYFSCTLIG
jgi:hypothetical protein